MIYVRFPPWDFGGQATGGSGGRWGWIRVRPAAGPKEAFWTVTMNAECRASLWSGRGGREGARNKEP